MIQPLDRKPAASVIIVGFDGLQPRQVTADRMPNLTTLAQRGVRFENHHSVFPTVTRVNMASIQTGCYPGTHGLAGNNILVREFDPTRQLGLNGPELTALRDATGEMMFKPTLGELLAARGLGYAAVGIGGMGNAFMQYPSAAETGGMSIHYKFTTPAHLHDEIVARFGPWPPGPDVDIGTMHDTIGGLMGRAVDVLTEYVIEETAPSVSLLWCSEPDASQHPFGVGSRQADTAIKEADEQLGRLIEWLERTGRILTSLCCPTTATPPSAARWTWQARSGRRALGRATGRATWWWSPTAARSSSTCTNAARGRPTGWLRS